MLPALLCQDMIREAYKKLVDKKDWSWIRSENEILINNQFSGTANCTRGSATITNVTPAPASTDAGRQFRIGTNQPVYTITAVNVAGQTYTIDRIFGGTTGTALGFNVGDWYLTMPTDFKSFIGILDPLNNWQLRLDITELELNTWDSQRSATGTPWCVVSRRLSTYAPTAGQVQYEIWPYPTSQRNYPYFYWRRSELLSDATVFLGPLATRGDLLVTGGLALAAQWPGVEGRPNPYFNLGLSKMKWEEFTTESDRLQVLDEETFLTWWQTVDFTNRTPFVPIDARYQQNHDTGWGAAWPH
jgi:hypothetical protein